MLTISSLVCKSSSRSVSRGLCGLYAWSCWATSLSAGYIYWTSALSFYWFLPATASCGLPFISSLSSIASATIRFWALVHFLANSNSLSSSNAYSVNVKLFSYSSNLTGSNIKNSSLLSIRSLTFLGNLFLFRSSSTSKTDIRLSWSA